MNWEGVKRTKQPIFSYSAIGPRTDQILECRCSSAWSRDSTMGLFEEINAQFLSIGLHSLLSCTYYHIAEERQLVPYRYFKKFTGQLLENGKRVGECYEIFYVKPLGIEIGFLAKEADLILSKTNQKWKNTFKRKISVESMNIRDIVRVSNKLLNEGRSRRTKRRAAVGRGNPEANSEHFC